MAHQGAIDWHRQAARRSTDPVPAEGLSERPAPDDPVLEVLEDGSTRAALALVAEKDALEPDMHPLLGPLEPTPAAEDPDLLDRLLEGRLDPGSVRPATAGWPGCWRR